MPHLETQFAHLGLNATATVEPPSDGMAWYAGYKQRHAADGIEGRLVSQYSFTESWTSWEVHPHGAELVICTAGEMTLVQQLPDGTTTRETLTPGDYAINPPSVVGPPQSNTLRRDAAHRRRPRRHYRHGHRDLHHPGLGTTHRQR